MRDTSKDPVSSRIARLERKILALTSLVLALCTCMLAVLLVSANKQEAERGAYTTVEAHEFRLLGPNGLAGRLGFYDAGPGFQWPGLFLYDDKGKGVVRLYVRGEETETFNTPELEFSTGSSDKTKVLLYSREGGGSGRVLWDESNLAPGARLWFSSESGGLQVRQADGVSAQWPKK